MKAALDYFDVLAVADCAAQVLADHRASPDATCSRVRSYMRENSVRALRWLWRNGDASERRTVACRVLVWLGKDQEYLRRVSARIN